MADTEFGILIRAIDQASGTLKSVSGELERLQRSAQTTAAKTTGLSQAQAQLSGTLAAVNAQAASVAAQFRMMPGPIGAAATAASGFSTILAAATGPIGIAVLATAALTAGVAATAKILIDSSIALADHVEHVKVIGLQTGLTSRETEKFGAAMKNMGLTLESLTPAFRFLNSNIVEAIQKDGDARKAFDQLGISVQDLRTKTSGEIFESAIRALGRIENQAIKSDTAVKLLGRSALAVLPLAGAAFDAAAAQAERVGLVLSESEKRIGASIDESRDTIARSQEGMKLQAGVLASILTDPFLKMEAAAAEAAASVLRSVTVVASGGATVLKAIEKSAETTGAALLKVAGHLADIALRPTGLSAAGVGAAMLNQLGIPRISVEPGKGPPAASQFGPFQSAESIASAKAIQDQLDATRKTVEQLDLRRSLIPDIVSNEIKALETMKAQVLSAEELLAIKSKIAALKPVELAEAKRAALSAIDQFGLPPFHPDIRPPLSSSATTSAEGPGGQIRHIVGDIDETERAMIALAKSLNAGHDAAVRFAQSVGNTVANAFGSFVSNVIRGVDDIGKAFEQMIINIAAQAAAEAAAKGVLSLLGLPFQAGGTLEPLRAQAGLIMSGVRGMDTVPILAGRGETIVSHTMTDRWDRTLSQLGSLIDRMPAAAPQAAQAGNVTVPVSLTVNSHFVDRAALREFVEDNLTDLIVEAVSKGSYRRGG